jgi:hypothetical protein
MGRRKFVAVIGEAAGSIPSHRTVATPVLGDPITAAVFDAPSLPRAPTGEVIE